MTYAVNPSISRIEAPPIMEAQTWIRPGLRNRKLLNLCQAVPSYPPATELLDEVARAAHEPGTSLYTDIFGLPELRAALAAHMSADYRGTVLPEQVCITSGCNMAFSAAIMAMASAGDNVIVPVPYFFNHTMWLGMLGIEARYVPAMSPGSPWPRAADAAPLIDSRTRAIVLCSPNNPTGAIYPPEVIESFFDLAVERGLALVIDETYKDFREDPAPPHGIFGRGNWPDGFVHLYSFSKVFSMTGYRVGSIIAGARFPGRDREDPRLPAYLPAACVAARGPLWSDVARWLEARQDFPHARPAGGAAQGLRPRRPALRTDQFGCALRLCPPSLCRADGQAGGDAAGRRA